MAEDTTTTEETTTFDPASPEVKALVAAAVAESVKGLKTTNDALKIEKTEIAKQLKAFDGLDAEKVRGIMERVNSDEEAALMAAGKMDEVIEKRMARANADFQTKAEGFQSEIAARQEKIAARDEQIAKLTIDTVLLDAGGKAGVVPEAFDDLLARGRKVFSINEDGERTARHPNGELMTGTDPTKPIDPAEWMKTGLPKHFFPPSDGGNAAGGAGNGAAGTKTMTRAVFDALPDNDKIERMKPGAGWSITDN